VFTTLLDTEHPILSKKSLKVSERKAQMKQITCVTHDVFRYSTIEQNLK